VEAVERDQVGAGHQRGDDVPLRVEVGERLRGQHHVVGGDARELGQHAVAKRGPVAVGQQAALGPAGGAGGVLHVGDRGRRDLLLGERIVRRRSFVGCQVVDQDDLGCGGEAAQEVGVRRRRDGQPRSGVVDEVLGVGRAVADVERHHRGAEAGEGEPGEREVGAVVEHHRDPVSGAHPTLAQRLGPRRGATGDLAEGQRLRRAVAGDEGPGRAIRPPLRGRAQHVDQRHLGRLLRHR